MQVLNKQNMIRLQRTTCGDDCLGAARCVPSATIPAANQASTTPANSAMMEQGVVATGREKSGGEAREAKGGKEKIGDSSPTALFSMGQSRKPPPFQGER